MNTPAHLGRICSATVLAPDFDVALASYQQALGAQVSGLETLHPELASHLALDDLAGMRVAWIATGAAPWLRVVEAPSAVTQPPMQLHGWLSLEVLVADVDTLAASLPDNWRMLRPPADLDVSPDIRACQVLGPSGELYYFTQVRADVPPFELPQTSLPVDRPFIVVLSTPDRDRTQAAWEALAGRDAWAFDTRITVLNHALNRPLESRYPVAVLQFRDRCLIEIDEVAPASPRKPGVRYAGVHLVSIERDRLDGDIAGLGPVIHLDAAGYQGRRAGLWQGPSGERVELIEQPVIG